MFEKEPKILDQDDERDAPLREPFWEKDDEKGKRMRTDAYGNVMTEGEVKERIEDRKE